MKIFLYILYYNEEFCKTFFKKDVNFMKICGIVCEYNPFHNGHMYHIEETRKLGMDGIVCIMSGNFVQRGDFAIMQKHARAEAAVRGGADVVIELPIPWAIASAERFASGAVSLMDSLGVVSHISFGAETQNLVNIVQTAKILTDDAFSELILKEYASGISFARARDLALEKFSPELSDVLKTPNNILAVEYVKALLRRKSDIIPIAVERTGAMHDGSSFTDNIASASYIRELSESGRSFSDYIPESASEIFRRECENGNAPMFIKSADSAILASLKRLSADDFLSCSDVSEGLEHRLFDAVSSSVTLQQTCELAKTKRYAYARIRRILLNAFLGIKAEHLSSDVPYARILAFNDTGRAIIKKAKKCSQVPIITKPSAIKNESKSANDLFALEKRADDIYSIFMKNPTTQGSTFTSSPLYIKEP